MKNLLFLPAFSLIILFSCRKSDNFSARRLVRENNTWEIMFVHGLHADSILQNRPKLIFDLNRERCSGDIGCNTFSCGITWNWNFMQFGQISATQDDCGDGSTGRRANMLNAMQRVSRTIPEDGRIKMVDDENITRIVLVLPQ